MIHIIYECNCGKVSSMFGKLGEQREVDCKHAIVTFNANTNYIKPNDVTIVRLIGYIIVGILLGIALAFL